MHVLGITGNNIPAQSGIYPIETACETSGYQQLFGPTSNGRLPSSSPWETRTVLESFSGIPFTSLRITCTLSHQTLRILFSRILLDPPPPLDRRSLGPERSEGLRCTRVRVYGVLNFLHHLFIALRPVEQLGAWIWMNVKIRSRISKEKSLWSWK